MPFKSWRSYWAFLAATANSRRYIFDEETKAFLDEVLSTCGSRQRLIKQGSIFWRSQLGVDLRPVYDDDGNEIGDESFPYSRERMKPQRFGASEGRVNPKGIPYLYLATTKETAMSEVRPWVGSEVSLAKFQTVKDLTIIDCSVNHFLNPMYFDIERGLYEPNDEEKEKSVWAHIDKSFSQPVLPNESMAHYAPTQILAELFKTNGLDGVVYKSLLGDGHNVALFNPDDAEILNCSLFVVKNVTFNFSGSDTP